MLWESTDPAEALQQRFGLPDFGAAASWLSDALATRWDVEVRDCDRLLISADKAIAWVGTDRGELIVKWSGVREEFARLSAAADLLHRLDGEGLPVAAPLRSIGGDARVIIGSGLRPVSMTVLPEVAGDLLDVTRPDLVHAAGSALARLHRAMAAHPDLGFGTDRDPEPDLHRRVGGWLRQHDVGRAPEASARLQALLDGLPALDAPVQLIHNDYRAANIVTTDVGIAAVLDFDDVIRDHPVCDLAHAAVLLGTRFHDWGPTPRAARDALLRGYRSVTPLSDAAESWLAALILWWGVMFVPPGEDPTGWAAAVA